jgi:hypothetical protein
MVVSVQDGKLVNPHEKSARKQPYYTFWVHMWIAGTQYVTIAGWKYYPDTKKIGLPSIHKGAGHYNNIIKIDHESREFIRQQAEATFTEYENERKKAEVVNVR